MTLHKSQTISEWRDSHEHGLCGLAITSFSYIRATIYVSDTFVICASHVELSKRIVVVLYVYGPQGGRLALKGWSSLGLAESVQYSYFSHYT